MKNKKLLVANWKMNEPPLVDWGNFSTPKSVETVICPPFPYFGEVKRVISHTSWITLGAQDVFWKNPPTGGGAFTGEVSPSMLKELGVEYVIIGHSERRRWLGETDEMIHKKVIASLKAGLKAILCVGEPKETRAQGIKASKKFVANQIQKGLEGIKNYKLKIENLTVAYEPIWAIGTGTPDKPENSAEMAEFIKSFIAAHDTLHAPRVLYGGSVKSENVEHFFNHKEIDGALVGSASLDPKEFSKIAEIISKV